MAIPRAKDLYVAYQNIRVADGNISYYKAMVSCSCAKPIGSLAEIAVKTFPCRHGAVVGQALALACSPACERGPAGGDSG